MRGNTGTPLIRRGADEPTGPATAGSELEVGGVDPTPGGGVGVITHGFWGSRLVVAGVAGATVADSDDGQGSVRKDPVLSLRSPLRQRATTLKRYVVAGSSPLSVVFWMPASRADVVGDQMP
jgi:hypothetical protein